MKKSKSLILLILAGVLVTSCWGGGSPSSESSSQIGSSNISDSTHLEAPEDTPIPYSVDYYDNVDFNDYVNETSTISNQWEAYGIGDPYVMRYNGTYYLYVSTKDGEPGIKAWKSIDLVNWEYIGLVATDPVTTSAYAPEVFYFNGDFYLYTSPAGQGHYILKSKSPEGPFEVVTGNLGLSIDGSVFITDDEKMYFLYASVGYITVKEMASMTDINGSTSTVRSTSNLGGWTEGPDVFKHNGNYYLTYTGVHVSSDGYRVNYAVAEDLDTTNTRRFTNSFRNAYNSTLLLNADKSKGAVGLGHPSSVLGPDMDSYYIAYHSLNSSGGPNRALNIDRLLFNGTYMMTEPNLTGSVKPTLPDVYSYDVKNSSDFSKDGNFFVSKESTDDYFTAEFNSSKDANAKYIFGFVDNKNYSYVQVDYLNKSVDLYKVSNGTSSKVTSGTLVNDFSADDNHTIRISYAPGKLNVFFDDLNKIVDFDYTTSKGKIGYYSENASVVYGFIGFSNNAYGSSDQKEITQALGFTPATAYVNEDGEDGRIVTTINEVDEYGDDITLNGAKELTLKQKGDFARYLVNFKDDGFYGLTMTLSSKYTDGNHKVGVRVDNGDVYVVKIPKVETNDKFVTLTVTEIPVTKGVRTIKLENVGTDFGLVAFKFYASSETAPSYSDSLSNIVSNGANYQTIWKIKEDHEGKNAHFASNGSRQLLYFGDDTINDFTLTVKMSIGKSTGTSTSAGILFRGGNYVSVNDIGNDALTGYYLSVYDSQIVLRRCYFGISDNLHTMNIDTNVDQYYTYKIVARGNTFEIYRDGNLLFSVTDGNAITNGRLGLYTTGATAYYKDLSVAP